MFLNSNARFLHQHLYQPLRRYSLCCPPTKPPRKCGGSPKTAGRNIVPPPSCRPGPIPYNPCVPIYHHGKDTYKKFMYITLFISFPLIIFQAYNSFSQPHHGKKDCRDYEYMRIRTKRFPWGDGTKSFFHNPDVNFLPGECGPPPLDCD